MKLVIVESPTKARTLGRYLGKEYQILASMGHVRDLPKKKLSVDVEHDFKPQYEIIPDKTKILKELMAASKKATSIILATDPDREGEAIAYHIAYMLEGARDRSSKFIRITFHEITKPAIEEALKNPGKINLQLFHAQQARRILDRLVGYKLSPLLWSKVRRGLSAGRVQSVALRLIVEREKEIKKFEKKEYWTVETRLVGARDRFSKSLLRDTERQFDHKLSGPNANIFSEDRFAPPLSFIAFLFAKDGEKYEIVTKVQLFAGDYTYQQSAISNQQSAAEIVVDLKKQKFVVENVEEKETTRAPAPPFITSTLQQTANRAFGFSGKKTMSLAQRLYEEGFITYHRTDSFNLAGAAVAKMRDYIRHEFGEKYLAPEPRVYQTRSKVAQEAHEAIRPTEISSKFEVGSLPAGQAGSKLDGDAQRLYELIWKRAVATQMAQARFNQTSVDIKAGPYLLKAGGLRTLFDGYLKLYPKLFHEHMLPKLDKLDQLDLLAVLPKQNLTSPPPRYNEASLIKTLEAEGIGRPSTYAPIISLIQVRGYVEKKEAAFWPTAVGEAVIEFLAPQFPDLIDIPFTASMEEDLDAIAAGEKKWVDILARFYGPFEKKLKAVVKNSGRVKIETEKTGKICPLCKKGEVVVRTGRFGRFLSCSLFPECKWKGNYQEKVEGVKCPTCGNPVVVRRSRRGRQFYGCAKWPGCKWASWYKPKVVEKT